MKKLNLYKILLLIAIIISLSACGKENSENIQNISLTQWQNITVNKKAVLLLKAKIENNSLNYIHITTLIALSPPMSIETKSKLTTEVKRLSIHNQSLEKPAKQIIKYLNSLKCQKTKNNYKIANETYLNNIAKVDSEVQKYADTHSSLLKYKNSNSTIKTQITSKDNQIKKQDVKIDKTGKAILVHSKTIQKNILFHDSNFPSGKYLTFDKLPKLQNGKFKNTFYITGKFIVNSKFNDAYNCSLDKNKNLIEEAYDDVFDSGKQIVFEIKFPYPTGYIKKGSLLFFKQNYPLKIYAKYIVKNNDGSDYIKLRCIYNGVTVHAISVAN